MENTLLYSLVLLAVCLYAIRYQPSATLYYHPRCVITFVCVETAHLFTLYNICIHLR